MMNRLFLLFISCILLSACGSDEVEKLKSNLGQFQYSGLDPQLSFSISVAEFEPADSSYESPTVKYTIGIKQNNKNFPINKYEVYIPVHAIDNESNRRSTLVAHGVIENGVLSLSNVESLYGLKLKNEADLQSLKLSIEEYSWSPINKFKPFSSVASGN